ncbi:hypothetical protein GWI33_010553 [Rhynchophorus ferrugineus]|uniref:Uncharacterized protein n=1 Tax=Rhynchophorus ferrugineus TaxID=354439 RepID=A0A834IQY6_RHYFE|nr:hypothetical protein GWI33_010553 [Rhynchophorus ferrugineus]
MPPTAPILLSATSIVSEIEATLGWTTIRKDDEVKEAVTKFISGLAAEFFEAGLQKWRTRQEKCVEKSGDYVKK